MLKQHKNEIIAGLFLIGTAVACYFLYGILISFLVGLLLAFGSKSAINRIQRRFSNHDVATTLYLLVIVGVVVLFLVTCTSFINRDFNRFNDSFSLLLENNQEELDDTATKVKGYINDFISSDEFDQQTDSLITSIQEMEYADLDTESISSGYEKLTSYFSQSEPDEVDQSPRFGFWYIFFSTLLYYVLILYQLPYFEGVWKKYFRKAMKSNLDLVLDDFNQTFLRYLRLRTKIVLWLSLLYIIAFFILDMPGMILITILIVLLSYVPYLQYLALIPLALGCLVLSIEHPQSFLFYFGIVVGVFVLASIIEEVVLTPYIMESNIGMNPVIMVLAVSVWSYLLGTPGTLIGIPLTSLLIIYTKRMLLPLISGEGTDELQN